MVYVCAGRVGLSENILLETGTTLNKTLSGQFLPDCGPNRPYMVTVHKSPGLVLWVKYGARVSAGEVLSLELTCNVGIFSRTTAIQ